MTYQTNDYSTGSKVVLSPDQQQTISNQYKRYMKALEYTSDSVRFEAHDPNGVVTSSGWVATPSVVYEPIYTCPT